MNRNASESAVDRLIALASDEKPASPPYSQPSGAAAVASPDRSAELEPVSPTSFADLRELEHNPMWKALLQFRVLVPYLARLLEVSNTHASPPAFPPELKQSVTDLQTSQRELQTSHRDLRTVVQDQMLQMKRVEEDTAKVRAAAERNATQTAELAEDVKAVHSLMKILGVTLGSMMLVLIGLVIFLLARGH